jgi:aspartyl-tRNA(Asn)/glutamyl-tRNA(Gln) amidotransferase subunit B
MTFEVRQILDVGVGHPAVARLGPQTSELANWLEIDQAKKLQLAQLYSVTLTQRLVECHKVHDALAQKMIESIERLNEQNDDRVREVPQVMGLQKIVESFLYEAKNYLRDLLKFFEILYACDLNEASVFGDLPEKGQSKLSKWASSKLGDDHPLTKLIRSEERWTSELIHKRNAVDHPDQKSGRLNVENILPAGDSGGFIPPTWGRTGRRNRDILKDMDVYLDNMLTLAEDLLASAVLEDITPKGLTIHEIPVESRDPKCPARLQVVMSPEFATLTKKPNQGKLIKGATGDWEMVIGLEVHAQVISNSKLFSGASTEFGGEPNSHVSLVDAAMPGMLPVINEVCIRQAVRTGLGLKAQINLRSVFDRKNYFFPDLPQGYQISQYKQPIVGEGEVVVELEGGETATVGIERLHLEQDAGKSLHDQNPTMSLIDLNRSGVALMEIVSKPDMRTAEQARAYVAKLRSILRYLGTCDGDMEKGSLRADVNVSVRKPGDPLGTRCEIKNVNSIRFIGQAIEYEARRQIGILEDGGSIEQETRLFDPDKGETRSMRSKEEAHDYRYFPDPDLLPLEITQEYVETLKAELPELPGDKKTRFMRDHGLSVYDADVLVAERDSAAFYEAVLARLADPARDSKLAANWLINELFGRLNKEGRDIAASPVSAAQLAAIVDLIGEGTISGKIAKDLFEIVWAEGGDPRELVEARGMKQVTDVGAIEQAVDEIIAANPDKAAQARVKPQLVGWFVGQVMKASGGKANPQSVNDLLKSKLGI